MLDNFGGVSLAAMLAADVDVSYGEAVAIVRELCTRAVAAGPIAAPLTPGAISLDFEGHLTLSPKVTTFGVPQLGELLEVLLLGTGRPRAGRLPPALLLTLARAIGEIDGPGFRTSAELSEALARFETVPRRELLQGLFAKWIATREPKPVFVVRPPFLRTGWIALVAVGSMAAGGALAVLTRQPAGRHDTRVATRIAARDMNLPLIPAAPSSNPPSVEVQPSVSPAPREPRRTAPPRPLVDSNVVERIAMFSPSFGSTESAVFFHTRGPAGSALKRADSDDASGGLHVATILEDGAKNYHVQLSPDGGAVAFDSDRDGERGVYTARADGGGVVRVSGDGYSAIPKWSPDGQRLMFAHAEPKRPQVWNVWTLDLSSGEQRRVSAHSYGQTWPGAWFADGQRVCYSHEDRLIVADLASGRQSIYPSPLRGRLLRTPAVSPDGRWVMFQVFRDGGWLLDLSDGSMQRVLDDPTAEEFTWSPDGRRVAFHSRRSGQWGLWVMSPR